ncbi:transmembrane anterior posterior transformation protein 1 homolog [Liolophura sinensis]|uniref:transmembrane anterior posterior transformation protein 1 homolog n=1 Tax=Liolophura sinensis TaxID=3198878 RepID=UPI0031587EB1
MAADDRGDSRVEDISPQRREISSSKKGKGQSLLNYLTAELSRGYLLERDEAKYTEKRERVYSFMKTPKALERFLFYGFLQCVDAFLFIFTFLPLRIFLALLRVLTHPCGILISGSRKILEPAQMCDVLKGIVLIACCFILNYVDTSMMYHIVRGQAVIKLYIFYNMLEVADKLLSSFGQDILDTLFWTATEPRARKREHFGVIPHLLLAVFYVFIHSMLTMFQATVLNVAFNSHNKSLLTIMMSNNFVEIKGNVFRRMDKNNLFQLSCSDAKERFFLFILLFLVFIRNMKEFDWSTEHLWVLLPDAVIVLMAEFFVDWFKHAFVTKFNEISSDVYHDFTVSLAYDMSISRQKYAFTDHSDLVSRRMTFTPLPLACLVIHIVSKSVKVSGWVGVAIFVVGYFCLITLKLLTSIIILGRACELIRQHKAATKSAKEELVNSSVMSDKTTIPRSKSFSQPSGVSAMDIVSRKSENKFNVEHQPSINSQMLFSNSTVSIDSIALNEEVSERSVKAGSQNRFEATDPFGPPDTQEGASLPAKLNSGFPDVSAAGFKKISRTVSLPSQSIPVVIKEQEGEDSPKLPASVRSENDF